MSEKETAPAERTRTDEKIEEIHEIQEEIFDRDDEIDDLLDAAGSPDVLEDLVEAGYFKRKHQHLERLQEDWRRLLENSRERAGESDYDFELSAAMVHFVGDLLASQPDGADKRWIRQLKKYLKGKRAVVN